MLDTLQKMSGTTHKSFTDSKTITRDMQKIMMQNEGKASYTMTTKEVPVISYNDMAFISERNSIVFRAGDAPIWNRNETILPMSWRLFKNTITQPGKSYSLQTIPTLSSALDFDIRQNQPDFVKMLDKRMAQAGQAEIAAAMYKEAYGYSDAELAKLDIDAYSDEIMDIIVSKLNNDLGGDTANTAPEVDDKDDEYGEDDVLELSDEEFDAQFASSDDGLDFESFGSFNSNNIENDDAAVREANERQAARAELDRKIYAGRILSKSNFIRPDGNVSNAAHQFDSDVAEIFASHMGAFFDDIEHFREIGGNLHGIDGKAYIIKRNTHNTAADIAALNAASQDGETMVYGEEEIDPDQLNSFGTYEVTDDFYKFLVSLDAWTFADNFFEDEMRRRVSA